MIFKTLKQSFNLLSENEKHKLKLITFIQILLGVLDLFAVLVVGFLGAISVAYISGQPNGSGVSKLVEVTHLINFSVQIQVLSLSLFSILLFLVKNFMSAIFFRKTFYFLGRASTRISKELLTKTMQNSYLFINRRTSKQNRFAITDGVDEILIRIVGSASIIATDAALLILMFISIFYFQPLMAILVLSFFSFIFYFLSKFMNLRSSRIGTRFKNYNKNGKKQ